MFDVVNNMAYINGLSGIYDGKIANSSARYGRNAASNYQDYISHLGFDAVQFPNLGDLSQLDEDKFEARMQELDLSIDELKEKLAQMPPINFEYTYSEVQDGSIDTLSLIASSYEELDGSEIKTKELTKMLQQFDEPGVLKQVWNNIKAVFRGEKTQKINFHPLKMSAKALDFNNDGKIDLAEYSTSTLVADKLSHGEINGKITNHGENASLALANKKNYSYAKRLLKGLYEEYNLSAAQQEFLSQKGNLTIIA